MTTPEKETSPELESTTDTLTQTKTAPKSKVVLLNDEDHTYDYVVEVLTKTCKLSKTQAFKCAVEVDLNGRSIVFYGDKEQCQSLSAKINSFGPDHRMPRSMGSMQSEVESF
jgi:ATP-dependent Clp protease adaptor protein ClpS